MPYETNLRLFKLRRLITIELIKSGLITLVMGIIGFLTAAVSLKTGLNLIIIQMTLAICMLLYAITIIRLIYMVKKTDPDKIDYMSSTDRMRWLHGTISKTIPVLTGKEKKQAHELLTETDVVLTQKIDYENNPFKVDRHGT